MKVLVMGTSHVGSVQLASDWIEMAFPSLDITYYSLPGAMHSQALMIGSTFGPTAARTRDRRVSLSLNDCAFVDLAPFDHIFHVGERFSLSPVTKLMADSDILERSERGDRALMTLRAARALIEDAVYDYVDARHHVFGDDPRFTFMPAPYPLARAAQPGPGHEATMAPLNTRDNAPEWARIYEGIIEKTLHDFGYQFLPQPDHTRHDAFSTKDIYARPSSSEQEAGDEVDNRHMNIAYGQEVFAYFAQQRLGLDPAIDIQTPLKNTGTTSSTLH